MKKFDLIIFDLDGTITDSQEGIINSLLYSLAKFDIEVADKDKLKEFIGPPLRESYRMIFSFTEAESEKAVKYYREYYEEKGIYEKYYFVTRLRYQTRGCNPQTPLLILVSPPSPEIYSGSFFLFGIYRHCRRSICSN